MIKPTEKLIRFQKKMIEAVDPFAIQRGDKSAFFTTREEPDIGSSVIDYVKDFVSKGYSGPRKRDRQLS